MSHPVQLELFMLRSNTEVVKFSEARVSIPVGQINAQALSTVIRHHMDPLVA